MAVDETETYSVYEGSNPEYVDSDNSGGQEDETETGARESE